MNMYNIKLHKSYCSMYVTVYMLYYTVYCMLLYDYGFCSLLNIFMHKIIDGSYGLINLVKSSKYYSSL